MSVVDLYINGLFWRKEEARDYNRKIVYTYFLNKNNNYNSFQLNKDNNENIEIYEIIFNVERQYTSEAQFHLDKERYDIRDHEYSSAEHLYIKNVAHCYDPLVYIDKNNELCVRNDIEIVKKETKNKKYNDKNKNKVFLLDLDD